MLVVGIVDDAYGVNARLKFALHFIAAFVMVLGSGIHIGSLGNLLGFGNVGLGVLAIPFSVACVVYIQNAINMMDGVDGLAGGNSFLVFVWMALAVFFSGHHAELQSILILLACLAGFLVYNMRSPFRRQAIIFLGDAGSMVLGLMIAWYAMTLSQGIDAVIRPVTVAWIIALPIVDSFGLLVARLKEGRPPFAPDRRHFHHHFQAAGFSAGQTTMLILLYSAFLAAIGFFGVRVGIPDYVLGWMWVCLWFGHTILTIKSEKFIRLLVVLRLKIQRQ
jgi:UDP-GlcNAc:undecaprenyl-phosphate GlcNAc-1-phosphate transferase